MPRCRQQYFIIFQEHWHQYLKISVSYVISISLNQRKSLYIQCQSKLRLPCSDVAVRALLFLVKKVPEDVGMGFSHQLQKGNGIVICLLAYDQRVFYRGVIPDHVF